MYNPKKSLYLILFTIIILTVTTIISINSAYNYINIKNNIINNIKNESNNMIVELKNNIKKYIQSLMGLVFLLHFLKRININNRERRNK